MEDRFEVGLYKAAAAGSGAPWEGPCTSKHEVLHHHEGPASQSRDRLGKYLEDLLQEDVVQDPGQEPGLGDCLLRSYLGSAGQELGFPQEPRRVGRGLPD